MASTDSSEKVWRLDRSVSPISLILGLVQLTLLGVWIGGLQQQVIYLESRIEKLEASAGQIGDMNARLVKLETYMSLQLEQLREIELSLNNRRGVQNGK